MCVVEGPLVALLSEHFPFPLSHTFIHTRLVFFFTFLSTFTVERWCSVFIIFADARLDESLYCKALKCMTERVHHILDEAYPIQGVCHAWQKELQRGNYSAWQCREGSVTESARHGERPGDGAAEAAWSAGCNQRGWTGCSTDGRSGESSDLFLCYRRSLSVCTVDVSAAASCHTHC